jgi:hypothetical protein
MEMLGKQEEIRKDINMENLSSCDSTITRMELFFACSMCGRTFSCK